MANSMGIEVTDELIDRVAEFYPDGTIVDAGVVLELNVVIKLQNTLMEKSIAADNPNIQNVVADFVETYIAEHGRDDLITIAISALIKQGLLPEDYE